jgi:hypothetical protein
MAPKSKSGEGEPLGSETSEWLAVPGAQPPVEAESEPSPRETEHPLGERRLRAELEEAERQIKRQQLEIEEQRREIDELSTHITRLDREAPKKLAKATTSSPPIDLNMASFEDLRGIGLSVTQSARVVAYRDVRGEIGSVDELSDLPWLTSDALDLIRERTRISG